MSGRFNKMMFRNQRVCDSHYEYLGLDPKKDKVWLVKFNNEYYWQIVPRGESPTKNTIN